MQWVLLLAGGWLAATVSEAAGFGGALLLLPVLTWTVGPKAAVPVLTLAQLLGNLSRAGIGWRDIRWRPVLLFSAGAVLASLLGARLFVELAAPVVQRAIGTFLLAIVAFRHTRMGKGLRAVRALDRRESLPGSGSGSRDGAGFLDGKEAPDTAVRATVWGPGREPAGDRGSGSARPIALCPRIAGEKPPIAVSLEEQPGDHEDGDQGRHRAHFDGVMSRLRCRHVFPDFQSDSGDGPTADGIGFPADRVHQATRTDRATVPQLPHGGQQSRNLLSVCLVQHGPAPCKLPLLATDGR